MERLIAEDEGRDERQLGVVDAQGVGASWTGPGCNDWAGHRTGPGYAAQGNILVGRDRGRARGDVRGEPTAAPRGAADRVPRGSAGRGRRPARPAVRLSPRRQRDGGYAPLSDVLVDLRVDDHERPIEELRRLYELHDRLFGLSPREEWLPLDGELRAEVDERLARLGYDSLDAWAGVENLEERVDGEDAIDPVVLDALREASW